MSSLDIEHTHQNTRSCMDSVITKKVRLVYRLFSEKDRLRALACGQDPMAEARKWPASAPQRRRARSEGS